MWRLALPLAVLAILLGAGALAWVLYLGLERDRARPELPLPAVEPAAEATRHEVLRPPAPEPRSQFLVLGEIDAEHVRGVVVDRAGRPVAGARVTALAPVGPRFQRRDPRLEGARSRVAEAMSERNGAFALPVPPGVAYEVEAAGAGGMSPRVAGCLPGDFVELPLGPPARVHGTVNSMESGGRVAGVALHLFRGDELLPCAGAVSDARGEYSIGAVAPGAYRLAAVPRSYAPSAEVPLRLEFGANLRQDFALARGQMRRGTVVDARSGEAIAGAEVSETAEFLRSARSDERGIFELPVAEGTADWLQVRAPGYAATQAPWADPLIVRLAPAGVAVGRVLTAEGEPCAGALLWAVGMDTTGRPLWDWCTTTSDFDGRFVLEPLRRDCRYALRVDFDGCGALVFDFPPGAAGAGPVDFGDLMLSPAAELAGRVLQADGQPLRGVEVLLAGGNLDRGRYRGPPVEGLDAAIRERYAVTDALGRYRFDGLAAGHYQLRAQLVGRASPEPAALALAAGAARVHDLLAAGLLAIGGVVQDAAGRRQPHGAVELSAEDGSGFRLQQQAGPEGEFRFSGLMAGTYSVLCTPRHDARAADGRELLDGRRRGLTAPAEGVVVVLPAVAPVTGRVLDRNGRPVPRLRLRAARGGEVFDVVESDPNGAFALRVPEGALIDLVAELEPAVVLRPDVAAGSDGLELRLP